MREAIARKFEHENGLIFGLNQIAVANGGKQIIFNALMATIDEGDEVILSAPYFVSYPEMVRLVSGIPVSVPCPSETGFLLTPEALEGPLELRRAGRRIGTLFEGIKHDSGGRVVSGHFEDIAVAHPAERDAIVEEQCAGILFVDSPSL